MSRIVLVLSALTLMLAVSAARTEAAPPETIQLPLRVQLYTRQVQLGTLEWVPHMGVALGGDYPSLSAGAFRFFPTWRMGYEHHAQLQERWYFGVAPTMRAQLPAKLALELSLGVSAAHVDSFWHPYHFDDRTGRWSRGESEAKWTGLFEVDVSAWFDVTQSLGIGLGYGVAGLYPFAPENDVPALPLTRLGLYGRWIFGA